jgi:hypothetical protein
VAKLRDTDDGINPKEKENEEKDVQNGPDRYDKGIP